MNMDSIPEPVYDSSETIMQSVSCSEFTVRPGVHYIAPEGSQLTMTVDGVEMPLEPRTYCGDIRLSVTEVIPQLVTAGYFSKGPITMRAALYVNECGVQQGQSVTPAISGASFNETGLSGGKIQSNGKLFNGIIINGGNYAISNMELELTGRGGDDFIGLGAAILTSGNAKVTIVDCKIITRGVIRPALTAGGNSEVTFKHCEIMTYGGDAEEEAQTPGMNNVPWPLGLTGNCRATNIVNGAKVLYDHCTLRSSGWGVLSTDDPEDVEIEAKDCLIEITGSSGYGSYSVGNAKNTFNHCVFRVPDYALIVAEAPAGGIFKNGTEVYTRRNAIMWHACQGGITYVEKGCAFHTSLATFLIKSCAPKIFVDRTELNPENGVILQMMDTDDAGLFGKSYDVPDNCNAERQKDFDTTIAHESDLFATFSNMEISGDFYNGSTGRFLKSKSPDAVPYTSATNLVMTLENVTLRGVVSAAVTHYKNIPVGGEITPENNKELGNVVSIPAPSVNNGVLLTLKNSVWKVGGTSYLTSLTIDTASVIQGRVSINGEAVVPEAGKIYTGNILVERN